MQPGQRAEMSVWSTDCVKPAQRLDYWVGAVCECFLDMKVTAGPARFHGRIESAPLDQVGLNLVTGSGQDVYRTHTEISRGRDNYYYLLCDLRSPWSVEQQGRNTAMQPHDLVLVDSRRTYAFHYPKEVSTISLELPLRFVEFWLGHPDQHLGKRIDGTTGWGVALGGLARQLRPDIVAACAVPARLLSDQLGSLLALALEGEAARETDRPTVASELRRRIADAIRTRYSEPGLTASDVATQLEISERSLHRALQGAGKTFGEMLLECRMAVARRLLTERRYDHLGVGGIGLRIGLADPSHFIRLCRRHLGTTPGAIRRSRTA